MQVPLSMFDSVDFKAERKKGLDEGFDSETLQILDWLKQEYLQCPIELESSYSLKDGNGAVVGECNPSTLPGGLLHLLQQKQPRRMD
jgi:hypothetical protein